MSTSYGHLLELIQIETDECVLWDRTLHRSGYPVVYIGKQFWYGNRLACTEVHGVPSDDRMEASHTCGQSACVNGRHLRWETRAENERRKFDHGTRHRGSECYHAKLTPEQVEDVRRRYAAGGITQRELGDEYGLSQGNISAVILGKTYAVKLRVAQS